jgi:hypothetical protein
VRRELEKENENGIMKLIGRREIRNGRRRTRRTVKVIDFNVISISLQFR